MPEQPPNRPTVRLGGLVGAATVAMLLGACSDDDAAPAPSATPGAVEPPAPVVTDNVAATIPAGTGVVDVSMADISFEPAKFTVPAGTTVVWTNDDGVEHTVTADDGNFDSGVLASGASFEFTFDVPGTYAFACDIHPNMQGVVTVEG